MKKFTRKVVRMNLSGFRQIWFQKCFKCWILAGIVQGIHFIARLRKQLVKATFYSIFSDYLKIASHGYNNNSLGINIYS